MSTFSAIFNLRNLLYLIFPGLKPQDREPKRSPKLPENFDELLEQAIQLKREVPKRSVRQIIYILELE